MNNILTRIQEAIETQQAERLLLDAVAVKPKRNIGMKFIKDIDNMMGDVERHPEFARCYNNSDDKWVDKFYVDPTLNAFVTNIIKICQYGRKNIRDLDAVDFFKRLEFQLRVMVKRRDAIT